MTNSSSFATIVLVVSVLIAIAAYRTSESFRRSNGVTPWNLPSIAWGVIFGFSWLIGLILFSIARRSTLKKKRDSSASIYSNPSSSSLPLTARPAAAWYADPTMRHELRFWDGAAWTHRVMDSGAEGIDQSQ